MSQSYTASGIIHQLGEIETRGTSGFQVRTVVIEEEDNGFKNYLPIEFTKDKVNILDKYKDGDEVSVTYNVRGREYNGRYFVNLVGWKINVGGSGGQTSSSPSNSQRRAAPSKQTGTPNPRTAPRSNQTRRPAPPPVANDAGENMEEVPF